ncbi:MAG: hypothetical protein LBV30_10465 [Propionibacteriaceae bacterium]|jgi:hypothetical protein|nr:hypothetical protein [Propionibacteriaceae bacterium]
MTWLDRLIYRYRQWRYRQPPLPQISLNAGATFPAWLMRLAAAVAIAAAILPVGWDGVIPRAAFVVAVLIALVWQLIAPSEWIGCLAFLITVVAWLIQGQSLPQPLSLVSGLAVYFAWRWGRLAAGLAPRDRIAWRAVWRGPDLWAVLGAGLVWSTQSWPVQSWVAWAVGLLGLLVLALAALGADRISNVDAPKAGDAGWG